MQVWHVRERSTLNLQRKRRTWRRRRVKEKRKRNKEDEVQRWVERVCVFRWWWWVDIINHKHYPRFMLRIQIFNMFNWPRGILWIVWIVQFHGTWSNDSTCFDTCYLVSTPYHGVHNCRASVFITTPRTIGEDACRWSSPAVVNVKTWGKSGSIKSEYVRRISRMREGVVQHAHCPFNSGWVTVDMMLTFLVSFHD